MKNLYIDFDGVIMDTINMSYDMLKELNIDPNNNEDDEKRTKFYQELEWSSFLDSTPQINDSFNCIQKILNSNLFNTAILTHCNSLDEAACKVKFIRKYLKDITIIPVPKSLSKTKMVHAKDAILIDDFTENLRQWQEAGGIGIRFSQKLNGKGFKAINSLEQIIDIFEPAI